MEALKGPWRPEYLLAVGGGLLLALAATVVGLLAGRRVFVALEDLERLLSSGPPPGTRSAAERREDEVGRIARVWRETDGRLRAALDREQRFTRDASHELRTPIAAARVAVELLRAEPDASPARREELLRRVDTALLEMGDLVGAFLWLARAPEPEREGLDREEFSLTALVERILAERATILRPDARVHWERRGEGRVEGSERLATVVLGNLLGNALVHGTGELWVSVEDTCITVRNNVKPSRAAREAQCSGFGRTICFDLCARFGWRLESWQREDDFFVRVEFRRDFESAASRS
jgi:signal transduction histidine kinase